MEWSLNKKKKKRTFVPSLTHPSATHTCQRVRMATKRRRVTNRVFARGRDSVQAVGQGLAALGSTKGGGG